MTTEGEAGYTSLQRQLHEYDKLNDPIIDTETNFGYLIPQNQPCEYQEVTDDSNSFPTPSISTRQAVSSGIVSEATLSPVVSTVYEEIPTLLTDADDEAEYSSIQSQYQGYVGVEECSVYNADSKEQDPKSQPCGYVPITEYSDTLPSPPYRIGKQG